MNSGTGHNELDMRGAWCAIYTRHQHEKAIARIPSAKRLEVFLPLYNATRRWKDRTVQLSLPATLKGRNKLCTVLFPS
jgi:hypothetical protein